MKRIAAINLVLGGWLAVAPFVLTYSSGHVIGMPTDIVLGVLLMGSALWMLWEPPGHVGLALYEAVCGVCAMLTPRVLYGRMAPALATNSVLVGAMVLVVSLTEAWTLARRPRRAE